MAGGDRPGLRRRLVTAAGGAVLVLGLALVAADRLLPPPLHVADDLSAVVTDRQGRTLRAFTNAAGMWRLPATVDDVPERFIRLLLAREDKRFRSHAGVDPLAVLRATGQNLQAGHVVSGASTLTMQVARLLEPRRRTLSAKLADAARALQLERRLDKDAILGLYLTLAPYGGNLEGVRAASLALFGKEPRAMSTAEMALLVALPQAPTRLRPDRAPAAAREARDRVLALGVEAGILSAAEADAARAEAVPTRFRPWPLMAPHLAEQLHRAHPSASRIATTLDGALQRAVETLAQREVALLENRAGVAILVVDNETAQVRAMVGAPHYLSVPRSGAIDMTRAVRSPGSTLKPFIYALAFDDRILRPETIVTDASTRFGDYAPENFDNRFHGDLTAAEALQLSRNVPAVQVLDRLGPVRFANALERAGAVLHFPDGAGPGLPLALGGVGVTLRDLTTLYVALASRGLARPLAVTPDAPAATPVRLVSSAAARAVLGILVDAPPPAGIVPAAVRRDGSGIAVKTGTSYGYRDAWAFAVSRTHTVGVWVGRPDGAADPDGLGIRVAAPLAYKVFDLLPRAEAPAPPPLPGGDVPVLLRRLAGRSQPGDAVALPDALAVRLVYPPEGAVLPLAAGGDGFETVTMIARGGLRPLTWLVDDRPVGTAPRDRSLDWRPDRGGPARITVLDAGGRSDSVTVEIR